MKNSCHHAGMLCSQGGSRAEGLVPNGFTSICRALASSLLRLAHAAFLEDRGPPAAHQLLISDLQELNEAGTHRYPGAFMHANVLCTSNVDRQHTAWGRGERVVTTSQQAAFVLCQSTRTSADCGPVTGQGKLLDSAVCTSVALCRRLHADLENVRMCHLAATLHRPTLPDMHSAHMQMLGLGGLP